MKLQQLSKIVLLSITILFACACSSELIGQDTSKLENWKAGDIVTTEQVKSFGIEKCFVSEEISDAIFKRIDGLSYKKDCTIPLSDLRYIKALHLDNKGNILLGEMIVSKSIATDVVEILKALYNQKYPIERMILIDEYDADDEKSMQANNSSSFNFRAMVGSTKLSKHAMGLAIDINPLYNPYVKEREDGTLFVSPEEGRPYVDRTKDFIYKISENDACVIEFKKRGFTWGGDWTTPLDYQHFEK